MQFYWYAGVRVVSLIVLFGVCGALIAKAADWSFWASVGMICLGIVLAAAVSLIRWNRWVEGWWRSIVKKRRIQSLA